MLVLDRIAHFFPRKARKDIICYKVLRPFNHEIAQSPYYHFNYILGQEYTSSLSFHCTPTFGIHEGIHALLDIKDAFELAVSETSYIDKLFFGIYECVIPKGSKFFRGVWGGDHMPSIATERLTVVRCIDYNNPADMFC